MASAGRVLPINKGTYNSATTYAPLDIVYYNEGTYCCKKACTNVTPAEGEYWQKWVDVSGKVNKEAGKGLSTNDFTNAEKAKTDNAVIWSERKGYVGKNLIEVKATSGVVQNITYTVNSDKTITANGTAAYESGLNLNPIEGYTQYLIPEGEYILSDGGVGTANYYVLIIRKKGENGTPDYNINTINGNKQFTVDYSEYDYFNISVHCKVSASLSNVLFKPMLRPASIADDTYEPYLISNTELQDKSVFWEQAKGFVGKNILPITASTTTFRGVTYTINPDKSVTINGTATGGNSQLNLCHFESFPAGNYRVTGCPSGGTENTYKFQIYDETTSSAISDRGDGIIINKEGHSIYPQIVVLNGVTVNNLTFYPMIRPVSVKDGTYEPYLPSNEVLKTEFDTFNLLVYPVNSGIDLNNMTRYGLYSITSSPTHAPENVTWAALLVLPSGNFSKPTDGSSNGCIQVIIKDSIYVRKYSGSPLAWSNWKKYTGSELS